MIVGASLLDCGWTSCLAVIDWAAWGPWAVASMVAATLLGAAMNRRRQALTQTLTDHVVNTIGSPKNEDDAEEDVQADGETVA
jgi:hypothetical protein